MFVLLIVIGVALLVAGAAILFGEEGLMRAKQTEYMWIAGIIILAIGLIGEFK